MLTWDSAAPATCVSVAAFLGVAKITMRKFIDSGGVCRDYLWRYAANHEHSTGIRHHTHSTASGGGAAGLVTAREDKAAGRMHKAQETSLQNAAAAASFSFSSERSVKMKAEMAPDATLASAASSTASAGKRSNL